MKVEIESAWPRHPDYRIDLVACPATGQVTYGEVVLARSDRCLLVQEQQHVDRLYFPESDVRWELFEPTEHHTICPFKGRADYWSLTGNDEVLENVAWTYRDPFPEVAGIEGFVCFYQERVRVTLDDRRPDGSVVTTKFP